MKYIRTKDGIKPICGANHITNTVSYYISRGRLSSTKVDGSRTADTIEELCDEFVYVASEKDRPVICYKPTAFHKLSDNLYGAIWTDKGLIYVAKMNDKGELELL